MLDKNDIPEPKIRKYSKSKSYQVKRKTKSILAANNTTIKNEYLVNNKRIKRIAKKLQRLASERHHTKIFEMNEQTNDFIKEAFIAMEQSELFNKIQWRWNKKLTSTMGMAYYVWADTFAIPTHIEFSPILFLKAPLDERKQTVFHEAAHIVDYYTGNFDRRAPHGTSWRTLMIKAGMQPKRCHSVKVEKKSRKQKFLYKAKCNCSNGVIISKICYGRIKRGLKYLCRKCKKGITL